MRLMAVDDDESILMLIKSIVEPAGHAFFSATNGKEAQALFRLERPDVVVLDIMMPHMDGYAVCRHIREEDELVPVLFLSAKGDIVDKRVGFDTGGDDYLTKPFDGDELLMRVEALYRRVNRARESRPAARPARQFELGGFRFDMARHQITVGGEPIALTPNEFSILTELASHHGDVMSKEELIEAVWGNEYNDGTINIAVYIRHIREKIEYNPARPIYLKTVWGIGYVFEP